MNYFTYRALLTIHDKILDVSGGMSGVKDEGLLRGPLSFIQDDSYYPSLTDKLTHIVYSLVKNHGFNDRKMIYKYRCNFVFYINFYKN